jgi:hypothetical protein
MGRVLTPRDVVVFTTGPNANVGVASAHDVGAVTRFPGFAPATRPGDLALLQPTSVATASPVHVAGSADGIWAYRPRRAILVAGAGLEPERGDDRGRGHQFREHDLGSLCPPSYFVRRASFQPWVSAQIARPQLTSVCPTLRTAYRHELALVAQYRRALAGDLAAAARRSASASLVRAQALAARYLAAMHAHACT